MGVFHAQAERGLNGSLHPPECCHHRFRAKRRAALPHVAAPPSCSMWPRRISLALHPRYGCLIAEETSDAHPTRCRGERGPCFHRRRTSRAGAGRHSDRPIRVLVGYPAGGGVDIVARLFAEPLKAALGQSVIVENRTGASGMIAAAAVAKSPPDGLTLLMAASGEVAINQHLYKDKMSYDPPRELVAVALIGIVPCVVVVATSTPVRNAAELIAYARANRGRLSFSSSGIGNPQQLAGELMNSMAGTDVLHVPYRGAAPAVTDVATGAVTMSFSSLAAALPLIQDGRLRAVAVTSRSACRSCPTRPRSPRQRSSSRATSSSTGSGCLRPPPRRVGSSRASMKSW